MVLETTAEVLMRDPVALEAESKLRIKDGAAPSSEQAEPQSATTEQVELSKVEDSRIGTILLGKVEIKSLISEGNRGRVYLGWHRQLGVEVAVKFLHDHFVDNSEKIERFKREAKAASSVVHPSIVKVFDYGFAPNGQPFMIMEYVAGGTLADLLKTRRPEMATFLEVVLQLVQALSYAHSQGIVHRDLKPENILISTTDNVICAKIADWGIARVVFANELSPEFTGTGDILGSPAYMSPEQCLGRQLDEKSDIYSLGCVMYEWITGTAAFTGRTAFDCMRMHVESLPPLVTTLRADVPPAVAALIAACIQKDPQLRFGSGADLQRAIKLLSDGKYQEAMHLIEERKKSRPVRATNSGVILALILITCSLIAVPGLTLAGFRKGESTSSSKLQALQDGALQPIMSSAQSPAAGASGQIPEDAAFLREFVYDFERAQALRSAVGDRSGAEEAGKLAKQAVTWFKAKEYPRSLNPSFHVVGFYSGDPLKKFDPRGTAKVRVSCKGEPTILALFSEEEVYWKLSVDPGVQISKIFLISTKPLHLEGAPPGVTVERVVDRNNRFHRLDLIGAARGDRPSEYAKLAGKEPDTWIGNQDAGKSTWVVGPSNSWWLGQRITKSLEREHSQVLSEQGVYFAPELKNGALHVNLTTLDKQRCIQTKFGSLLFPSRMQKVLPDTNMPDTFADEKPISRDKPITYNGGGPLIEVTRTKQFFNCFSGQLREVDPSTGNTADADLPTNADRRYIELSLCATPDGKGLLLKDVSKLFECKDARNIKWEKLADLLPKAHYQEQVLQGLANAPGEKAFFTLYDTLPESLSGFRYLRKFDRTGKVLSQVKLTRRVGAELAGRFSDMQLLNLGPYLVAFFQTTDQSFENQFPACYYVIDPNTGSVLLVGPVKSRG